MLTILIPGGLGAATFVAFAANYGVTLTIDEARELIAVWFEHFPEMRDHLKAEPDDLWVGRNIRLFLEHHKIKPPCFINTVDELADLLRTLKWDEQAIRVALMDIVVYQVRTVTGRLKRNCSFCSAANLRFQGPAADGAKVALWEGYARGWRMVDFIHDEILQEVSLALSREQLGQFVHEVEGVMVDSMQRVLPHMKIKVESALMLRWYKEAKPKRDADGFPMIWVPPTQSVSTALTATKAA